MRQAAVRFRSVLLIIAGVAIIALIVLRGSRPGGESSSSPRNEPPQRGASYQATLKGVAAIIIRNEKDERVWEFQAERIEVTDDHNLTRVENLKKGIYYRADKPSMIFSADEVVYDARTKGLEITGHVKASDVRGVTLMAPHVIWQPKERRFVCLDEVQGELKGLHFSTRGVHLWPDRDRVVCPNPIRASTDRVRLTGKHLAANLKTELVEIAGVVAFVRLRRSRSAAPSEIPPLDPTLFRRRT
jgi:hypothetical protein